MYRPSTKPSLISRWDRLSIDILLMDSELEAAQAETDAVIADILRR